MLLIVDSLTEYRRWLAAHPSVALPPEYEAAVVVQTRMTNFQLWYESEDGRMYDPLDYAAFD